jgi:hypothetical protein
LEFNIILYSKYRRETAANGWVGIKKSSASRREPEARGKIEIWGHQRGADLDSVDLGESFCHIIDNDLKLKLKFIN